ncbi:MAG: hypothetical protein K9M07_05930 [Simkaniaceae bacterium]|nr:hypothetical protein [Simkaniaceae bacterium]MCF7852760.1 hypothetical protein [Simkaniaceae bacterium]
MAASNISSSARPMTDMISSPPIREKRDRDDVPCEAPPLPPSASRLALSTIASLPAHPTTFQELFNYQRITERLTSFIGIDFIHSHRHTIPLFSQLHTIKQLRDASEFLSLLKTPSLAPQIAPFLEPEIKSLDCLIAAIKKNRPLDPERARALRKYQHDLMSKIVFKFEEIPPLKSLIPTIPRINGLDEKEENSLIIRFHERRWVHFDPSQQTLSTLPILFYERRSLGQYYMQTLSKFIDHHSISDPSISVTAIRVCVCYLHAKNCDYKKILKLLITISDTVKDLKSHKGFFFEEFCHLLSQCSFKDIFLFFEKICGNFPSLSNQQEQMIVNAITPYITGEYVPFLPPLFVNIKKLFPQFKLMRQLTMKYLELLDEEHLSTLKQAFLCRFARECSPVALVQHYETLITEGNLAGALHFYRKGGSHLPQDYCHRKPLVAFHLRRHDLDSALTLLEESRKTLLTKHSENGIIPLHEQILEYLYDQRDRSRLDLFLKSISGPKSLVIKQHLNRCLNSYRLLTEGPTISYQSLVGSKGTPQKQYFCALDALNYALHRNLSSSVAHRIIIEAVALIDREALTDEAKQLENRVFCQTAIRALEEESFDILYHLIYTLHTPKRFIMDTLLEQQNETEARKFSEKLFEWGSFFPVTAYSLFVYECRQNNFEYAKKLFDSNLSSMPSAIAYFALLLARNKRFDEAEEYIAKMPESAHKEAEKKIVNREKTKFFLLHRSD